MPLSLQELTSHPRVLFVVVFAVQVLAAWVGHVAATRGRPIQGIERDDYDVIQTATLTLLGLIIGFSFSMAIGRYDQRKNLEEEEANAIGTEYLRADLLPATDGAKVRALLRKYLDQRVLFYTTIDADELPPINDRTAALQVELWAAVTAPAAAQPNPVTALAVAGMNDVLNSQGYVQAAWWNRIPFTAWVLMIAIAICCNILVGRGTQKSKAGIRLLLVLPFVVSIAFLLIADIDTPRRGFIRVVPQNLLSLSQSLHAP